MVGVTPMIDENDDHQVYDQADARQLPAFARRYHLGMVSFRDATRDANACTGGSLSTCTNVPQQRYGFARLLGKCAG
nr:hypothetical protein KitaXyl93_16710 [Kitasatospora sp. Xyl93]